MTNAANTDDYSSDFTAYMVRRFNASGSPCGVDPSAEEIAAITEEAKKHRNIVMGTCNAHLYRGQLARVKAGLLCALALTAALAGTGLPMTVIAMRNPYDLSEIPEVSAKLSVFDYTLNGLCAAENFLKNGSAPGKMPVRL